MYKKKRTFSLQTMRNLNSQSNFKKIILNLDFPLLYADFDIRDRQLYFMQTDIRDRQLFFYLFFSFYHMIAGGFCSNMVL